MRYFVVVFCLSLSSLTLFADAGLDGIKGEEGGFGSSGSNGSISINFIPTNATFSYPLYLPILSCDINEVERAMLAGSNVNEPIYTSRRFTPLSVAIISGCVEVLEVIINNSDERNRPDFDVVMFNSDDSTFNIYQYLLIKDESQMPNIAVRPESLSKLKLILPYVTNALHLKELTSDIVKILTSSDNIYSNYPNNLTAVSLIKDQIRNLGLEID